jgi:hypothetical protein
MRRAVGSPRVAREIEDGSRSGERQGGITLE